jgi:hypothetical protein
MKMTPAIAALPKLIDALQFAVERLATLIDADEATPLDRKCFKQAVAALRKARVTICE